MLEIPDQDLMSSAVNSAFNGRSSEEDSLDHYRRLLHQIDQLLESSVLTLIDIGRIYAPAETAPRRKGKGKNKNKVKNKSNSAEKGRDPLLNYCERPLFFP